MYKLCNLFSYSVVSYRHFFLNNIFVVHIRKRSLNNNIFNTMINSKYSPKILHVTTKN